MLYRTCPTIIAPTEADLETPEIIEAAAAVERLERDMRVLDRLVELGLELAEAIAQSAKKALEAEGGASTQDPTGPYNKMAQTIRRTIALRAKLAEEMGTGRAGLAGQRAARRRELDQTHSDVMEEAIAETVSDVLGEDFPDLDGKETDRLLEDVEERLYCDDDFTDFVDRPVGETVAKLCAAMGLDPALCFLDGDTWKARRGPYPFEETRELKACPPGAPPPAASLAASSLSAATGPPG